MFLTSFLSIYLHDHKPKAVTLGVRQRRRGLQIQSVMTIDQTRILRRQNVHVISQESDSDDCCFGPPRSTTSQETLAGQRGAWERAFNDGL